MHCSLTPFRSYFSGKAKPQRSARGRSLSLAVLLSAVLWLRLRSQCHCFCASSFVFGCVMTSISTARSVISWQRRIFGVFLFFLKFAWQLYQIMLKYDKRIRVLPAGTKSAPAELLRWDSTIPDAYVLQTHKHPPESRRRRWFDYNTPFSNFQVMSAKRRNFWKFFGILNLFWKRCTVYDGVILRKYCLYGWRLLSVRLGIVSLYETNRTYVFSLHIRPVFLLSFMQRMWAFCQIQAGGNQDQNKLTAALLRRINSLSELSFGQSKAAAEHERWGSLMSELRVARHNT